MLNQILTSRGKRKYLPISEKIQLIDVSSIGELLQAYSEVFFVLNESSVCSSITASNSLILIEKLVKCFDDVSFMVPYRYASIGEFKGFLYILEGIFENNTIVDQYGCTHSKI